jgi:hypothetical protein
MTIILRALLGSTIGVGCFHEFQKRMGYSLSYCLSDTAGAVTVLQTEQQTAANGGGVDNGRRITILRLCGGAPAFGTPGGEGRGGSGPRGGGSGGGSAAAASQQQQRGEGGAAAVSQQQHHLPRKRGRPSKAAAAQPLQQHQQQPKRKGRPTKGTTCAKTPTSTQTSPKAGSVDWHSIVLEDTDRTVARAKELARKLRTFYKQRGARKTGHDIPTVERIRALWDGNPPTANLDTTNEQTTKRQFSQRSRRRRRDADSPGILQWTSGGEEESEYSPVDSAEAETCDRGKGVELKYAKRLTFFFWEWSSVSCLEGRHECGVLHTIDIYFAEWKS